MKTEGEEAEHTEHTDEADAPEVDVGARADETREDLPGVISSSSPAPGPDDVALPADASRITSILESLLFAADRPLMIADFKRLLGEGNGQRITDNLEALRGARADTGIQLVSVAGGWQLRTHPRNGNWVAKLVAGRPQRLSRAMMETLAIVAYRQPITRPEVDEIRGVDCGPVLRTLLERGLVRAIGKKEEVGRPILYGTTPDFLKTFSMRDLTELPTLREFHELGAEERAKVDSTGAVAGPGAVTSSAGSGAAAPDGARAPLLEASELPTYDASEEDALIDELEAATERATLATRARTDAETEDPRRGHGGDGEDRSGDGGEDRSGDGSEDGGDHDDDQDDDGRPSRSDQTPSGTSESHHRRDKN